MNTARLNPGIPLLLNGVSKRYGDNVILNELDLHIPTGQFVAVVGRSGGGKSTLLRLLAGLEKPNGGELLAGATPLAQIQDDTRMMFRGRAVAAVEDGYRQRWTWAEGPVARCRPPGAGQRRAGRESR